MRRWAGRLVAVLLLVPLGAASAQRLARPLEDRALRPGDVLRINVWRHPELSGDFVVAPDSTLVDPVYQVVKVAGAPLAVVRERLRAVLSTYEQGVPFVLEPRSEEHTSELQSRLHLVCRLLLEKKKKDHMPHGLGYL